MTIAQMVATAVERLILALIMGLITKNVIIAILFPILLIGFLLMWRRIKEETPPKPQKDEGNVIAVKKEVEVKEDQPQPTRQVQNQNPQVNSYQQPMQNQSQPPVSTNYPRRPVQGV